MQDLNNIKKKIAKMSALTLKMWRLTFQAFMEHSLEIVSQVLKEELVLNDMEKEITAELIAYHRATAKQDEKAETLIYTDVVGDLELIGDYCKDILERVEIKIEEKLLFSDEAVKEYEELYHKTEGALDEIVCALEKDSLALVNEVMRKEEHIDSLVDEYRTKFNQGMIDGVCTPMSRNMFLNILDFTAAIYYHTKKIARNLLKIKKE